MNNHSERLKKLRLEKGLTLEEVHKKTKVHLNILRALEGDSITHLNPVYLQGFLKIYCQFLGVDPKEFMTEHKETRRREPEPAVVKPAPRPFMAAAKPAEPATKTSTAEQPKVPEFFKNASEKLGAFRPNENFKKVLVIAVVGIVLVFGIFKLGKFIAYRRSQAAALPKAEAKKDAKTTKPQAKPAATEVKAQAKTASAVTPAKNTATAVSQQKSTDIKKDSAEIRLVIKARDNCWVTLKVDGKVVFHRVLEKGRSESWKAKERMDLALGSAGAVDLEVDGQLFSNLGRKGQALKNIVITRKGLEIGK